MSARFAIAALIALVFSAGLACGRPPAEREALGRLLRAMRAEIEYPAAEGQTGSGEARGKKESLRQAFLQKSNDGMPVTAEDLQQAQLLFVSDDVMNASESLEHVTLKARTLADLDRRGAEIIAKLPDMITRSSDPHDFDASRVDLAALARQSDEWMVWDDNNRRLRGAHLFIRLWQNYLDARKRNSREEMREALNQMLDPKGGALNIVPRSRLLELLEGLENPIGSFRKRLMAIQSLDEVRDCLTLVEVSDLESETPNFDCRRTYELLSGIDLRYRAFFSGQTFSVDQISESNFPASLEESGKIIELQGMLLRRALPRYIAVPADLQPADNEPLTAYLDRVVVEAKARQDFPLSCRAAEAAEIQRHRGIVLKQDGDGWNYYASGRNQEAAGQTLPAILAYLQALGEGSDLVPAKSIGVSLNKLKSSDPDAYRDALKQYLKVPTQRSYEYPILQPYFPVSYSILIPVSPAEKDAR